MELLKDYDVTIQYHPGKANVVADALSRKAFEDENVHELRKKTVVVKAQDTVLDAEGVFSFKGKIFVPRVDDLIQTMLTESHGSRYSIHSDVTKMYRDLMQLYRWLVMKKHIAEFVPRCQNYPQVTYEHQEPTGPVAYGLALPPTLFGVYPVTHVSMLKKYHDNGDYIIKWDSMLLHKDLQYAEEPIGILDCDFWKLRTKEIKSVKVQWKHRQVEEAT
ncbi:hypothetical protein MTR67_039346 [Solanum verrucosum]|uniref:Integrase zinc-binding domain-containing protein n=1 Tax=Solanum verrucosum TaxID=315347 RepID=A0AAF0ZNS5_SOLVR|nr:hypothetical protein MTR67_039346 [Solanum verrucosum]